MEIQLLRLRLKHLKPHILDAVFIKIRSATFSDEGEVYVDAETDQGSITIPISKEGLANILLGMPSLGPKKETLVPKRVAQAISAKAAKKASDSGNKKSRSLSVGQKRTYKGKRQVLEGFTSSGSVREKPPNVQRRVKHPGSGQMVWPIWMDT